MDQRRRAKCDSAGRMAVANVPLIDALALSYLRITSKMYRILPHPLIAVLSVVREVSRLPDSAIDHWIDQYNLDFK